MRQVAFHLSSFPTLSGLVLLLGVGLSGACSGTVDVGDPGTGGESGDGDGDSLGETGGTNSGGQVGGDGDVPGETGGSGDDLGNSGGFGGEGPVCAADDPEVAHKRESFEAWLGTDNDWDNVSGTFKGYIEGGADLTLEIDADGHATLLVGQPAPPPEKGKGYLCDDGDPEVCVSLAVGLVEGGTYPIHGATLDAGRLRAELDPHAVLLPWCEVQTPVTIVTRGLCTYDLRSSQTASWNDGICETGGEVVDCDWLSLVQGDPCHCDGDACFAAIGSHGASYKLDARYDDELEEFRGSLVDGAVSQSIYLFKD